MHGQFLTPSFNPINEVTKTSAYTATTSDSQINVSGATTITLPAISTLNAAGFGSLTYKIKCVDTDGDVTTISCNSADTIEDGSSAGGTSIYLRTQNQYVILTSNAQKSQWERKFPRPIFDAGDHTEESSVKGADMSMGKHYNAVTVDTNGTTAVNVFSSAGAPQNLTITGIIAVAKDTVAGNITLTNGTSTVAQFAKSTTAGVVVGEDGDLTYYSVTQSDTLTVVSSSTGNARVTVTYTATE